MRGLAVATARHGFTTASVPSASVPSAEPTTWCFAVDDHMTRSCIYEPVLIEGLRPNTSSIRGRNGRFRRFGFERRREFRRKL